MEPKEPHISSLSARELISLLDTAYPNQCIRPGETLESAHRYAGARDLIDELIATLAEEDEEAANATDRD